MTLKHVFITITFTCCTLLGFTSCNDEDYAPINLEAISGEGFLQNNILQLDAYSPGESFYIIGGNGRYMIDNQSKDIIQYEYDGNTIKFIPVGVGEATVMISDHVGNKMTLTIQVKNHTVSYKVVKVENTECKVKEDMTVGQLNELRKKIVDQSLMKVGGDVLFTYTDREQSMGSITIHPTVSGHPISGIFRQENKFSGQQVPYQIFKITLADNSEITWNLLNNTAEAGKEMLLQEDVTNLYKGTYPQLEKATLTYTITH